MPTEGVLCVDTSVFLRALLADSPAAKGWLDARRREGTQFYASGLMEVEARRVVLNQVLLGGDVGGVGIAEQALREFNIVSVTDEILAEAGALRVVLRGADAIHVATALALGAGEVTLVTHDAQMAAAAKTLGLAVFDPVTDDAHRQPVA